MKAMILAAGLGTRLKPFTDEHPKALAPVNGKPMLQRTVEWLQQYGITELIVNVHHFANQVVAAIEANNGWGSNISISDETEEPLETGGGIKKAAPFFSDGDPFLVMNADILTNMALDKMIRFHQEQQPLATLATSDRSTSRYLLFEADNGMARLCGWKSIKTGELKGKEGTPAAFSGIQILSPAIFNLMPAASRFSSIDVYVDNCAEHSIYSFDHSAATLVDIGTMEKLALAAKLFP